MSVTDIHKDPGQLTMTVVTELDAPPDRAWQLWADPRKLERWWGPPTYPATFVDHDLTPGGRCSYYMTGPGGDRPHGWWRIVAVDAPHSLELEDGFADEHGAPSDGMPVMVMRVEFTDRPGGCTMTLVTRYASLADMERVIEMGMEEGIRSAVDQIDGILAGD